MSDHTSPAAGEMPHHEEHVHEHDTSHDAEHVRKHMRIYISVFIALLVLTGVTVGVSYIHVGPFENHRVHLIIGLIIATIKAALVAMYFMHLNAEKWTIYRVLILAVIFALGLFGLTYLAYWDPITL